jgi:erythromycin esterase
MHEGLTAVALETGLAETRKVDDYIGGGPGDALTVVVNNLSWGFNELPENVALVAWLRDWNDAHPSQRVRIYGVDISGGDSKQSFGHARDDLDAVAAYLAKVAPAQSATIRVRLASIADRFSPEAYANASKVDRSGFAGAVADAQAFLTQHAADLKSQSGEAEWAWAVRLADDARDALHVFALWPADASKPTPGAIAVAEFRDRAMAERLLWVLEQEGPRGKVLLFQSNSHVAAAPLHPVGRPGADGTPTGQYLRKALGEGYRVILTASSMGRPADDAGIGEVDRVFVAAGAPTAMLDIRNGGPWWDQPHTLSHGGVRVNLAVPKEAYDGLMFIDRLTPVKRISP